MPKVKKTTNPHVRRVKRTKAKRTKPETAFPALASARTPGQAESIEAFADFEEHHERCTWWDEYVYLRESEDRDWRKAAYIAWAATPKRKRWPATLLEFAQQVLGLESDKVIYKWRKNDASIDRRVETFGVEALQRYLTDVIGAWVEVASTPDPSAFNDRKMYLEKMGIYEPRTRVENVTWQDEMVRLLRDGALTAQQVIEELGDDDAHAILVAAGQAGAVGVQAAKEDRAGDNPAVPAARVGGGAADARQG